MAQIRFDFLSGVNGGNNRSSTANANAAEPSGDAFARILDRQLARRGDDAIKSRAAEPRSRSSDTSDRTDNPRPLATKRRDDKPSVCTTMHEKPGTKTAPRAKQPEKSASDTATCSKPATKPQDDATDPTTGAAGTPAATENGASTAPTETETDGQPDTSGDASQQHSNDGSQQQASDGTDQAETAAAGTDLSLLAMLAVPLPVQALTGDADAAVDVPALATGGNAATALQAQLAASLAGSIDLGAAANGKVQGQGQGQAATSGLKFGAILDAGGPGVQKAAADAVSALQDAAEELTKAADPLVQLKPDANDKAQAATTKTRDGSQDKAAATVTPELTAKATASIVQPMNRATGVTWSGTTNVRNDLAEGMAVQTGSSFGADDPEFSNWSQVLGSGANGLSNNMTAKQSAFMTQLRANLQVLPPHEQIAVQIKDAMQNGNSRLTVALHPVELGRVEVKLDIDKDKNVTATIVVDRPATLDLLRNDAKALERALQDAGLQTDSGSLSFNLRDSNGQDGGARNGSGTGNGSGRGKGGSGSEVKAEVRADVVKTADGYVDLET
jgi:flagellar hook-length control protein FliK